ncbi:MAG TPA: FAD-dependent oxidoreductase [Stellaceae bacterium]|nr:FAD-dependent oxidoreductase [Stellaceae bacterium]
MAEPSLSVECCVAGGGPAGMVAGLLLARAGVRTVVLEKHADFLRDFRGDTIHPSTLEIMHELGFLEDFLKLPHQKAATLAAEIGERTIRVADFSHLPTRCRFIAFMPQWDFLDFLAERASRFPGFGLLRRTEVTGLLIENGRVAGVAARGPDGPITVRASLVLGADGRHSTVRERAGLPVETLGAPMDVLWFRLVRRADDPVESAGRFDSGRIFIRINRGKHWQCGFVIAKGSFAAVHAEGLPAFRRAVAALMPFAAARLDEIVDWESVKLLTVGLDRLKTWHRPGLLCIGDAAHTMSPVGGVGINLAIQDAVAAANILAGPLLRGEVGEAHLHQVQRRRELPTRATQRVQLLIQNRVVSRVLAGTTALRPPLALRLLAAFPPLRRLPARLIGLGIRPEHVRTAPADAQAGRVRS